MIKNLDVKSHAVRADLSSADDVADIIAEAVSELGRADILVNNAGIIKRNEAVSNPF